MFEAKHIGASEANNNIKSRGLGGNKRGKQKKNKVRKENFILVPGWAVCDLALKGNELLIYSIIYGFSQEENQTFRGSIRYLVDWTGSSKMTVIRSLKSLEEKKFIKKIERFENGVKLCEYKATRLDNEPEETQFQNDTGAVSECCVQEKKQSKTRQVVSKCYQGGTKMIPNNIVDNIDYSLSKKERATKSFDSLIDDYTENENLRKELKEHLKTRKMKKAALTNRAIELSLKKLDQLAVSAAEKLLIVQNAVMNGWTTFYPLKADEKRQLKFNGNNSNSSYLSLIHI